MRRILLLLALVSARTEAAPGTAIVLNSLDNTLSTADLGTSASTFGEFTFPSYTSEGILREGKLYVVVSGTDQVFVLDPDSFSPLDTLETGPGTNPYGLDVDSWGNVYVSLFNANEIVRFDASGVETGRVSVGRSPEDVLLHGGRVFVAATGFRPSDFGYDPGFVNVLDAASLASLADVPVGTNPQWMAEAGGEIHVVCTGNYVSVFGEAHVVDPVLLAPADTVSLGGSPGQVAAGDGVVYTADYFGGVFSYEAATRQVLHDAATPILAGGTGYSGLALDGAGGLLVTLFADDLLVRIRLADEAVDGAFLTGDGPASVVLREDRPVPVRLLSFDVREARGDGVEIVWSAAEEDEVASYAVDRRLEREAAWTEIARTEPGASRVVDSAPAAGVATYRLSALLRTGERETLAERSFTSSPAVALRVLTNPARGSLALAFEGFTEGAVSLHDPSGRLVKQKALQGPTISLDLDGIPAGVYFARVEGNGRRAAARVVVVP